MKSVLAVISLSLTMLGILISFLPIYPSEIFFLIPAFIILLGLVTSIISRKRIKKYNLEGGDLAKISLIISSAILSLAVIVGIFIVILGLGMGGVL